MFCVVTEQRGFECARLSVPVDAGPSRYLQGFVMLVAENARNLWVSAHGWHALGRSGNCHASIFFSQVLSPKTAVDPRQRIKQSSLSKVYELSTWYGLGVGQECR